MNTLTTLSACLESDYITISFLHQWSEKLIEISECPEEWLIRLTICHSKEEALDILSDQLVDTGKMFEGDYGEILIGFLYLAYKDAKITLKQFVVNLIDVVDAHEVNIIDLENILKDPNSEITIEEDINFEVINCAKELGKRSAILFKYVQSLAKIKVA